jgi:hypothetical protein
MGWRIKKGKKTKKNLQIQKHVLFLQCKFDLRSFFIDRFLVQKGNHIGGCLFVLQRF